MFVVLIACMAFVTVQAQDKALRGSGISTERTVALDGFDKIEVQGLHGKLLIETGKSFSIAVKADNNLDSLIRFEKLNENRLRIALVVPRPYTWLMESHITIHISLPEISVLTNQSNADVQIGGLTGRYLRIDNQGNGDVRLRGTVMDQLDLLNNGNGDLVTDELPSKKVTLEKSGNGNVTIRTNENFRVRMAGNGDVLNKGSGRAIVELMSGNGRVVYRP
jgi:hypothetical protein